MYEDHAHFLVCPSCQDHLRVEAEYIEGKHIVQGKLVCKKCANHYPIIEGIPRFVSKDNYAESFGLQWNIHNKTQYDHHSKTNASQERFERETGWEKDLNGQLIIEAGCGSGRFTEQVVKTNAMVISFDYSSAVKATYEANKENENLLIVQASIYEMPLKDQIADKLFCFGVLQHTPNPELSFKCLSEKVRPGGRIAADIYKLTILTLFKTKYWIRPLTRQLNKEKLYKFCHAYVDMLWPIAKLNRKLFPKIGRKINWQLLIPDYSQHDLDDTGLKEWAYLDIFDMLSPAYDKPKTLATFKNWFERYGFTDIDVHYGYNGIEGRATKK